MVATIESFRLKPKKWRLRGLRWKCRIINLPMQTLHIVKSLLTKDGKISANWWNSFRPKLEFPSDLPSKSPERCQSLHKHLQAFTSIYKHSHCKFGIMSFPNHYKSLHAFTSLHWLNDINLIIIRFISLIRRHATLWRLQAYQPHTS